MKVADFFQLYGIDVLRVSRDADIRDREISRVDVRFGSDSDDAGSGYDVAFKLLDAGSDTHRFLRHIGPRPDCSMEWTLEGSHARRRASPP